MNALEQKNGFLLPLLIEITHLTITFISFFYTLGYEEGMLKSEFIVMFFSRLFVFCKFPLLYCFADELYIIGLIINSLFIGLVSALILALLRSKRR